MPRLPNFPFHRRYQPRCIQQLKALQALNAKPSERRQVIAFGDVLLEMGKPGLQSGSDCF